MTVRNGSVAAPQTNISLTATFGSIADTKISRISKIAWPLTAEAV